MSEPSHPNSAESARCDCGASLAPGAQFCHICGRPVTEEAANEERKRLQIEQEAKERERLEQPQPAQAPRIGFGNREAVRACYLSAIAAALLGNIPFVNLLCFVWYPAAGFFSVFSYRRRTGRPADTAGGAMLGFITGTLAFTISVFVNALGALMPGVDFSEVLRSQVEQAPGEAETKQHLLSLLDNPVAIGMILVVSMTLWFAFTAAFTTLGGALGAKVMEED